MTDDGLAEKRIQLFCLLQIHSEMKGKVQAKGKEKMEDIKSSK